MVQHEGNHKRFAYSRYYFITEVADLKRGIPFDGWNFVFQGKFFVQKCCGGACIKENSYYSLFIFRPTENNLNNGSWSMMGWNQVSP
jgi:hypothetical protein